MSAITDHPATRTSDPTLACDHASRIYHVFDRQDHVYLAVMSDQRRVFHIRDAAGKTPGGKLLRQLLLRLLRLDVFSVIGTCS